MALTMRQTGLGSGIDKDRADYTVFTGEWEVGRIYETRGGPDNLRWFWSMTVNGPMTRSNRVATLEDATASPRGFSLLRLNRGPCFESLDRHSRLCFLCARGTQLGSLAVDDLAGPAQRIAVRPGNTGGAAVSN